MFDALQPVPDFCIVPAGWEGLAWPLPCKYGKTVMSLEAVKEYLKAWNMADRVREFAESCATVEQAAGVAGVSPARIAKTLSFASAESDPSACILVVASGDARIYGKKLKDRFKVKSKMLSPEQALALTGHSVGGVCPFAVMNPQAEIYLDISLRRFGTVFPACGSSNSLIEVSCEELFAVTRARDWVDVCKDWEGEQ